jgi:ABC-2 type transport system ATP-binding protein
MDILREFVSDGERSVLFSTHITSDLEKVADYISYIQKGRLVFTGEKDALLEQYALVKGDSQDLTPTLRNKLIGTRLHSAGFEGMLRCEELGFLPPRVEAESISLDEIIIFMEKEGSSHA